MEYIATIFDLNDIFQLNHANTILVGHDRFAVRLTKSFNRTEIKKIKKICDSLNKKVYVLVNKIFYDEELEQLKNYLQFLKNIDINGILFSDFSVFETAKAFHFENRCIFYHETLLRNIQDCLSYKKIGISKMVMTKDMHLNDILNLPESLINHVGLVVQGYFPIYYTKRKPLKNHIKKYHLDQSLLDNKNLYLKEATRNELYPLKENQNGMILFYHQPLSYYQFIDKISKKISFIIIDGIFSDCATVKKWLDAYYHKIENNQDIHENFDSFSTAFLLKKVGVK